MFAVREEATEQLGEDRFPLIVLDDPQSTFDFTHRHRWIQRIAALQNDSAGLQVLIATHDESFLDQLSINGMKGRRAHLSAAGADVGHLLIVEGSVIDRAWQEAQKQKTPQAAQSYLEKLRIYIEAVLKVMLRGEVDTRTMTLGKLRERIETLHRGKVTPWNRNVFRDLIGKLNGAVEVQCLESSHHSTGRILGMAEAIDAEKFWREKLSPILEKAFRQMREYRLLHGESKELFADASVIPFPEGHRDTLRAASLPLIGRAAALTDGRVADGTLNLIDFDEVEQEITVLGNHDAYRLTAATLEPVARSGDVLIVAAQGAAPVGALVLATCSDNLLARRFQVSADHPDIAVLIAQAVTPSAIASPLIAHVSTVTLRKIAGVLFDPEHFPGSSIPGREVADCGGDATVAKLVKSVVGMVQVSGDSAEPLALNGQYLLVGKKIDTHSAYRRLDGRPVLVTDSDGHQYFKRLRMTGEDLIYLESLHAGGEYPPVTLSIGKTAPSLTQMRPVVGVLFERQ